MARRTRVGLVFADALTREGRRMLLGSQPDLDVVYEDSDGNSCLAKLPTVEVDVILIDNRIFGLSGTETIAKFLRRNSATDVKLPAFVLTEPFDSPELRIEAVRCGATAVVTEEDDAEALLETVRTAGKVDANLEISGYREFFKAVAVPHGGNTRWLLRLANLDDTTAKVMDGLALGLDIDGLKTHTGLPVTKIRWTLDAIQAKLGLSTRPQLLLALYEAALIPA